MTDLSKKFTHDQWVKYSEAIQAVIREKYKKLREEKRASQKFADSLKI